MSKAGCAHHIAKVAVTRLFTVVLCGLGTGGSGARLAPPAGWNNWPLAGGLTAWLLSELPAFRRERAVV